MMDDFLSSGGFGEDFLEEYHDKRKLAHMRRVKVDKLKELTTKKQGPARAAPLPPGQGWSPAGVPNYTWGGGSGYEPYPTPFRCIITARTESPGKLECLGACSVFADT